MTESPKPVDLEELERTIKQALPMTMRNESSCEARSALSAIVAELRTLREAQRAQSAISSITLRTKLMELEAREDGFSGVAFVDDGHMKARRLAPFLFEDVELEIRFALPALPDAPEGEL
jgi:hypothetical protein